MEELYLAEGVALSVVESATMAGTPRWMLNGRSVFIGPYHSADERESHIGITVGSMEWLWSDTEEFRFDQHSLELVSAFLVLRETTLGSAEILAPWFLTSVEEGVPRLVEAMSHFQVDIAPLRWIDERCQALTSILPSAFAEHVQQRLRLRVAHDLELWFADQRYCGWSLLNPIHHIVKGWQEPSTQAVDGAMIPLVRNYLTLIETTYVELMEEQDPETKHRLLRLYQRAQALERVDPRAAIVRYALADKLERFYDDRPE